MLFWEKIGKIIFSVKNSQPNIQLWPKRLILQEFSWLKKKNVPIWKIWVSRTIKQGFLFSLPNHYYCSDRYIKYKFLYLFPKFTNLILLFYLNTQYDIDKYICMIIIKQLYQNKVSLIPLQILQLNFTLMILLDQWKYLSTKFHLVITVNSICTTKIMESVCKYVRLWILSCCKVSSWKLAWG